MIGKFYRQKYVNGFLRVDMCGTRETINDRMFLLELRKIFKN
jgi:hypothetical protein